jgi:hypothetical protein
MYNGSNAKRITTSRDPFKYQQRFPPRDDLALATKSLSLSNVLPDSALTLSALCN